MAGTECGCGCDSHGATAGQGDIAGSESEGMGRSLNEWTLVRPESVAIFQELGLDACCGGERTLAEACRVHGLDGASVLARLEVLVR